MATFKYPPTTLMKFKNLNFLCILFSVTGIALAAPKRPNIVLFLVDDMGWMDSSTYGSEFYETPNMTRLASEGMLFTQAYAQPLCSPTRAALMSGKYAGRLHLHKAITGGSVAVPTVKHNPKKSADTLIWPESRSHLPLEERTMAEALKDSGYQTWFLGKWHLGKGKYWPENQGFEKVVGKGGAGPRSYFSPYQNIPDLPDGPEGEYLPERLTQEACKLMEERDQTKPFFMYFAHFNVHSPYQAKDDYVAKYARKSDPSQGQSHPFMGAMIQAMDESLGGVLDKLDELGIADNTLFIFISDNGGVHWANSAKKGKTDPASKFTMPITSNAPLRGGKACYYEGGVRIPMVARLPGVIEAGSETDALTHVIDLYPTLLDLAGYAKPGEQILDGKSILPILNGERSEVRDTLYCHFPRPKTLASAFGGSFVREGDYKLIRGWGGGEDGKNSLELYNIAEDVGEENNLAEAMPKLAERLDAKLSVWLEETGALLPTRNGDLLAD